MINQLIEESGPIEAPRLIPRQSASLGGRRKPFLDAQQFKGISCWVRKRAERSGKPFLLMLLHIEEFLQANPGEQALLQLAEALYSSTREIDVAGWYQDDATLGVLFTEIDGMDQAALKRLLWVKVTASLRARVPHSQVKLVHIAFHFFPEGTDGKQMETELYPDLAEQDEARRFSHAVKRALDIGGSLLALALCSPLFVVIAVAIRLDSKGRVLFKQRRVGRYGKPFTLLKFRSMELVNNTEIHREYVRGLIAGKPDPAQTGDGRKAIYKIQGDPRITAIGKFLRKTSLDELPQFINVLKGEMSLVGPRPPLPYEVEVYQVWHRRRVLEAKPGITGLWQVNGRSKVKFDDMVRLDLQYARTWTLWNDIKILLQTPLAMFSGEGAY